MKIMRYLRKKITSLICMSALTAGILAGCGNSKFVSSEPDKDAAALSGAPVELKVVLGYQDELPPDNHIIVKELDKLANAVINIEWTPLISYNDKFNVMMSSNALPDVILIPDTKMTVYVNGVNAGMFWEIGLRINDYKYLREINPLLITNASMGGKLYIIPRERALKRKMVAYRSDWAKVAGLPPPDSIDNLYNMAKTFGTGDFDKNGEKDTIGLALGTVNTNEIDAFDALVTAFGGVNRWGLKDGRITPGFMTPEYLKTLKWLRKMYLEELISPDFAITKTTQIISELVDRERTGLWLSYMMPGLTDPLLKQKQQSEPGLTRSDIYNFAFLKGPEGKERIAAESGFNGGFAFPVQTVKNEARLNHLLGVFNMISSPEGQRLVGNGIEGLHYDVIDGKYAKVINPDLFKRDAVSSIGQLGTSGTYMYSFANDELALNLSLSRADIKNSEMIPDLAVPLFSESYSANKANLDKIINEAMINFIMGNIDEAQFDKAVVQWQKIGGNKVIEEYWNSSLKMVN